MQWFTQKPIEVWVALITGVAFVFRRSGATSRWVRALEAGISGGVGFSMAPAAARWTGNSEAIAMILLTSLGYLGLDAFVTVIADRAVIKEIVIRRLGGKSNGNE